MGDMNHFSAKIRRVNSEAILGLLRDIEHHSLLLQVTFISCTGLCRGITFTLKHYIVYANNQFSMGLKCYHIQLPALAILLRLAFLSCTVMMNIYTSLYIICRRPNQVHEHNLANNLCIHDHTPIYHSHSTAIE